MGLFAELERWRGLPIVVESRPRKAVRAFVGRVSLRLAQFLTIPLSISASGMAAIAAAHGNKTDDGG